MSCTLGSAEADAPRGKTFPYDARGLEIRSVEKADRGAVVVAVEGSVMLNALPVCNVS